MPLQASPRKPAPEEEYRQTEEGEQGGTGDAGRLFTTRQARVRAHQLVLADQKRQEGVVRRGEDDLVGRGIERSLEIQEPADVDDVRRDLRAMFPEA